MMVMKKIRFAGRIRYLGNALALMQGIVIIFITVFFLNEKYMDTWRQYPVSENVLTVYLKNLSEENEDGASGFLMSAADEDQLFIARKDTALKNDGTWAGFVMGVYGNPSGKDVALDFLNESILSEENLMTLLTSPDAESTLGVDQGSIYSVGEIPSFWFYQDAVVKKLPQLIKDSGTANGTYVIWGLDSENEIQDFLNSLARVAGSDPEELTRADGGSASDSSLMRDIYFIFLGAQIFLNMIFFLVLAMKCLPKQGKLALLGWSPMSFAAGVFAPLGMICAGIIPVIMVFGWILTGWGRFSPMLLGCLFAAGLVNLALTGVELFLAALVMVTTRSIDAIRGRIHRRPLYVLGIAAYLGISVGLVFCSAYVDQPVKLLSKNARISRAWDRVSDYVVMERIGTGEDGDSFSGASNRMDEDLYHWYSAMADAEGVYMIHTEYYSQPLLNTWQSSQTYGQVPEKPLWLFTMSPNYLETLGIHVDEESLEAARAGKRLYLFPDSMTGEEQETIAAWLKDRDTRSLESGDISTLFTKDPDFAFASYTPDKDLFTWTTDLSNQADASGFLDQAGTADPGTSSGGEEDGGAMTVKAPVIYVAVPENMKYTETEGIRVSGLDGYLKFADEETARQWTQGEILSQYGLLDNNPVFAPVRDYIDGLQKDLAVTLVWFGLVFFALGLILIGLLLVLASIYRLANAEKLNVKKFLGFGFGQMYRGPVILLSLVIGLEFMGVLIAGSRMGLVLVAGAALVQMIIFIKYMARGSVSRVLTAFKGE